MGNDQNVPHVSVIVPTMASLQRAPLLKRAIESIRASSIYSIEIIVVVNGAKYDTSICEWLKVQSDILYSYVLQASAPGAVFQGRQLVRTKYFSTLDDDDEYLPHSTDWKLSAIEANPWADFLVANAYERRGGRDGVYYKHLSLVFNDPLKYLMEFNWLSSGNALYRSASITPIMFSDFHPYAEWTFLAYRLMLEDKKVMVLNVPVCRHNDTDLSLSKSKDYVQSYIPLFKRMLKLSPPTRIANLIHRKIGAAYHTASEDALIKGHRILAIKFHCLSIFKRGGFQYLAYTRYLINGPRHL